MNIDNAVILITGASSGIGAATARAASAAGARVVLVARRRDRIDALAAELGEASALAVRCDVTDAGQLAAAVESALERFGRVDVLVNNAGQGLQGSVGELDPADFRAVLELNLVAPLAAIQAVRPAMRHQGGGAIVNVSSGVTLSAIPGTGAYSASKAGLEKLSEIARAELAGEGIVVSTLLPSLTATDFVATVRGDAAAAEQMNASVEADTPENVAAAILELIRSGEALVDLVPVAYGGSVEPTR